MENEKKKKIEKSIEREMLVIILWVDIRLHVHDSDRAFFVRFKRGKHTRMPNCIFGLRSVCVSPHSLRLRFFQLKWSLLFYLYNGIPSVFVSFEWNWIFVSLFSFLVDLKRYVCVCFLFTFVEKKKSFCTTEKLRSKLRTL